MDYISTTKWVCTQNLQVSKKMCSLVESFLGATIIDRKADAKFSVIPQNVRFKMPLGNWTNGNSPE